MYETFRFRSSDCIQCRRRRPTEAFALVGGAVDVDLGADDVAERHEHLSQLSVSELLRQMIDEQIAALWSCSGQNKHIFLVITQAL